MGIRIDQKLRGKAVPATFLTWDPMQHKACTADAVCCMADTMCMCCSLYVQMPMQLHGSSISHMLAWDVMLMEHRTGLHVWCVGDGSHRNSTTFMLVHAMFSRKNATVMHTVSVQLVPQVMDLGSKPAKWRPSVSERGPP